MAKPMRELMRELLIDTQKKACETFEAYDEKKCISEPWSNESAKSEGRTVQFFEGKLLEKGSAGLTTTVNAPVPEQMAKLFLSGDHLTKYSKYTYFLTSLSIIFQPYSPMLPYVHSHYRYCEIEDESHQIVNWHFGGGTDMMPSYLFEEDAIHFHSVVKEACDKADPTLYKQFKKSADDYYYIPHRKEHTGLGGTLTVQISDRPKEALWNWVRNSCMAFLPSYIPIVERRKNEPFTQKEKDWQLIRRGRLVEFTMLYEIGFRYGLRPGVNIEHAFSCMPPLAKWDFRFHPEPNSPEEKMLEVLKNPREWA